ncbi:MAG: hypothetical protein ACE10E_06560 [Acidiferrobacterales bacterium]
MRWIAVDAMGTDCAPQPEVEGAVQAAREMGVGVLLVGREDLLKPELEAQNLGSDDLPVKIVHASEAVTMNERLPCCPGRLTSACHSPRPCSVASRMAWQKPASSGLDLVRCNSDFPSLGCKSARRI